MGKDWDKHLSEWQSQGFLSSEQAAKIRHYEAHRGPGAIALQCSDCCIFGIAIDKNFSLS